MTFPSFATCRAFRVLDISLLARTLEAAWRVVAQLGTHSNLFCTFVHFHTSSFTFQPVTRLTRAALPTDILVAVMLAPTIANLTASMVASFWSLIFSSRAILIAIANLFKSKARPFSSTTAFTLPSTWILALELITCVGALRLARTSRCARNTLAIIASELVAITPSLALFPLLVAPVRAVPVPVAQPGLMDTVVAISTPPLSFPARPTDVQARQRLMRHFRTTFLILPSTAVEVTITNTSCLDTAAVPAFHLPSDTVNNWTIFLVAAIATVTFSIASPHWLNTESIFAGELLRKASSCADHLVGTILTVIPVVTNPREGDALGVSFSPTAPLVPVAFFLATGCCPLV